VDAVRRGLRSAFPAYRYHTPFIKGRKEVNICPGPNIAWFNREVSLQTMVGHIYGKTNIITDVQRPHMFIAELNLYINYFKEELDNYDATGARKEKYFQEFYQNLVNGISYYRELPGISVSSSSFQVALKQSVLHLQSIFSKFSACKNLAPVNV
jgi:hypothetical protein